MKAGPNGIAAFIAQNGAVTTDPHAGQTQVDVVNNNFVMPQMLRTSLALDYNTQRGYKFTVEGLYSKTIKDVFFQQVNVKDDPRYYGFDVHHQLPVYSGSVDPRFSNAYGLSNTSLGYRYSVTASIARTFTTGFNASIAYTYGGAKDVFNGIRKPALDQQCRAFCERAIRQPFHIWYCK